MSKKNNSSAKPEEKTENQEIQTDVNTDANLEPAPNVIFVGKSSDKAITKFENGMQPVIKLPEFEKQFTVTKSIEKRVVHEGTKDEKTFDVEVEEIEAHPFYFEKANQLVTLYRDLYKHFKPKGE